MATNHVRGNIDSWDHVAGSDIVSGDVVAMGGVTGVALTDILTGATGAVGITGEWSLAKDGATPYDQGDEVEWDGAKIIAKAAGTTIGFIADAALAADPTAVVRLERV